MDEIGPLLKETRESAGVSIKEASADLDIREIILENIEAGMLGAFKDIFELKNAIFEYSKYLGLDPDKMVDDFNSYLFEYTSKIPIKEIEKTMELQLKDMEVEKVVSPYTKEYQTDNKKYYVLLYVLLILLVVLTVVWASKQIS